MTAGSDDIIWYGVDDYIGAKVSFPSGSVWTLGPKIKEHAYYESEDDARIGLQSEARGVFFCTKIAGHGPTAAVIKIRLQIPWYGTAYKKREIRAAQATLEIPRTFDLGIEALSRLTAAHCSSTPSLLDWKKEKQADDEWVPGGYKLSILMERLPGLNPSDIFPVLIPEPALREERDAIRKAFKEAWLETVSCGVVHEDRGIRNILWDKQHGKCYLVDWELWSPPNKNYRLGGSYLHRVESCSSGTIS